MYTVRYKNVLWIDPAVRDYQVFVKSVNEDTLAIVYPQPLTFEVDRIGFVFEKNGPMAKYLKENVNQLIQSGVKSMDFLACETLPEWQSYYDSLTGIQVGASNNKTGNLRYGGDWLMESTQVDVEAIYFTHSIEYYKYLLAGDANIDLIKDTLLINAANRLWGIGFNRNNVLAYESSTENLIDITSLQSNAFSSVNILSYDTSYYSTVVLLKNGKIWFSSSDATHIHASYVTTTGFIQIPLKTLTGDIVGTPYYVSSFITSAGFLVAVKSGTTHSLYYLGGKVQFTNNTAFLIKYKDSVDPFTSVNIGNYSGKSINYLSGNKIYYSRQGSILNSNTFINPVKVLSTLDPNFDDQVAIFVLQADGKLFSYGTKFLNGLKETSTSFEQWIPDTNQYGTIVTHISTNNSAQCVIVTENKHLWQINCGFNPLLIPESLYPDFKRVSYDFGVIHDIYVGFDYTLVVNKENLIYRLVRQINQDNPVVSLLTTPLYFSIYIVLNVSSINKTTAIRNSSVQIYGSDFREDNFSYVRFGNLNTSYYALLSNTSLEVKVPEQTQTNASLYLGTSDGGSFFVSRFTIPPLPLITQFNPSSVFARAPFQLKGENFSDISYVEFGTKKAFPLSYTSQTIDMIVPVISTDVPVTIVDLYNNRSLSQNLSILNLSIGSINPTSAVRNASITIVGTNLSNVSYAVFQNTSVRVTRATHTTVNLSVPVAHSLDYLELYDIYGNNISFPFVVDPLFSVSGYNPSSIIPKRSLEILGSNFKDIDYVLFGETKSYPYQVNSTSINVSVPTGLNPLVSVVVYDIYTNSSSVLTNLSILNLSIRESTPTAVRGAPVTLTGINLSNISYVLFGEEKTFPSFVSDTRVVTKVPDRVYGNISVVAYDIYTNNISISFVVAPLFSVSRYSPSSVIPNTTLDIVGTNFSNISYVLLGTRKTYPISTISTSVAIKIPIGLPDNVSVTVVDLYDNASSIETNLTVLNLSIGSLTPISAVRNASLTFTGKNLSNISFAVFGNISKQVTRATDQVVNVSVPSNATDLDFITLYDIYENNHSFPFTLAPLFTLDDFHPSKVIPRTPLQIRGNHFKEIDYVQLGDIRIVPFNVSSTEIELIVPNGLPTNVSITVFDVYTNSSFHPTNLSILNLTIDSITPTAIWNEPVTVIGSNFYNISYVNFGGFILRLPNFSYTVSTLELRQPLYLTSNISVGLYDIYGNNASIAFAVKQLFSVSSYHPSSVIPRTPLLIKGSNFSNISYVRFNDIDVEPFQYDDQHVNVSVPPWLPDNVSVTVFNKDHLGYWIDVSLIILNLKVTTISPDISVRGTRITVRGDNLSNVFQLGFNDVSTNTTYASKNLLKATIPMNVKYTENVIFRDVYGNNISFGFQIKIPLIEPDPKIEDIRVDEISTQTGFIGSTIYLDGNNFSKVILVRFEETDASFQILSNHLIRIIIPEITRANEYSLVSAYAEFPISTFTPLFSRVVPQSLSGRIGDVIEIVGTDLSIVSVQFTDTHVVDAKMISSTPTKVQCIVPYGYSDSTIVLYDIRRNQFNVSFHYIGLEPVLFQEIDTSGITQDSQRRLYSWIPTKVTSSITYSPGTFSIENLVIDTTTLYLSNQTTEIIRYRIDKNIRLRSIYVPNIVSKLFLNTPFLYITSEISLVSGSMLSIFNVERGTLETYQTNGYTSLAFWKDKTYGSRGNLVYTFTVEQNVLEQNLLEQNVLESMLEIPNIEGTIKQILVVNDRLFVLSDNLIQYNLKGYLERVVTGRYKCMAYSPTHLLLSNNRRIDQIDLPLPNIVEVICESSTPSFGTYGTKVQMTGQNLDKISSILFDFIPAKILFTTLSTLWFEVPYGQGTPQIVILDQNYVKIKHSFQFTYQNVQFSYLLPTFGQLGSTVYLFGDTMSRIRSVYLDGYRLPFLLEGSTLRVRVPDSIGNHTFEFIDKDNNPHSNPWLSFTYVTTLSYICFPGETLIYTDQGPIQIKLIIPHKHTVYGKEIMAITSTQYNEDTLVCVEKGAIGIDTPHLQTKLSNRHKILIQGNMIEARRLVGYPGITRIPHDGSRLYNVLLQVEGRMNVQGMICETLDPSNPIAKLFMPII
jgi:hypothetical protein